MKKFIAGIDKEYASNSSADQAIRLYVRVAVCTVTMPCTMHELMDTLERFSTREIKRCLRRFGLNNGMKAAVMGRLLGPGVDTLSLHLVLTKLEHHFGIMRVEIAA